MKDKIADVAPALFDIAFDTDEIALAKMDEDLGPESAIARDAENPDDQERLALTIEHG
jgi:hypothetical protein